MECERPITLPNPRFGLYREPKVIQVSCGKCPACQQLRRKAWFFRLKVESNNCLQSYVVTLTYNDQVLPEAVYDDFLQLSYHPIKYSDIQDFHKRLRKKIGSFRFFAVCEYGSQHQRPHYHICYFFDHQIDDLVFRRAIYDCWFSDCRISIDVTNDRACNYILKYCLALIDPDVPDIFRPMIRCSNRPYIGYQLGDNPEVVQWFIDHQSDLSHYVGFSQRLPRIYRDKFFDQYIKNRIKWKLGSVMYDRNLDKDHKLTEYEDRTGVNPRQWERNQFNSKMLHISKLKSIK